MKPFWKPALETLQDLAAEPTPSLEELRLLLQQIERMVAMIEHGELKPMAYEERLEHRSRYGRGAFVVGGFVITKR